MGLVECAVTAAATGGAAGRATAACCSIYSRGLHRRSCLGLWANSLRVGSSVGRCCSRLTRYLPVQVTRQLALLLDGLQQKLLGQPLPKERHRLAMSGGQAWVCMLRMQRLWPLHPLHA